MDYPLIVGKLQYVEERNIGSRIYPNLLEETKKEIKSLWISDSYEEAEKRIQIITKRILNKFKNEST
jgi:hypothetical protein